MTHARDGRTDGRVRSRRSSELRSHREGRGCRDKFLYLTRRSLRKTVTDVVWRVMVSWRSPRRVFLAGWIIDELAMGSWDFASCDRRLFFRTEHSSLLLSLPLPLLLAPVRPLVVLPSPAETRRPFSPSWSLMQNTTNYGLLRCGLPISAVVFTLCTLRLSDKSLSAKSLSTMYPRDVSW